ncbi:tellurite resistance TerB family protein [Celerinatantimonas diazotrophica]|uniref:Putative tellurite resistance protein B-like protein n=1 Tax=Celerinatantimonas diazotrophica TaxID=412034 RepID=A0A4R1J910_9GAMM|nr:TerB family tellurite resistance protein [Celerinatantimonas diazotrophica]TCK47072.1 putative tellurite resistance protein B-like protein [Celerinatantimonas diazotrophica]CAG9295841.1 hypothetical protein CEDIAZO_00973 [Celerinatantimonas diazotrophica]
MLETLQQFIRDAFGSDEQQSQSPEEQLRLATAALLIQVSGADANESGEEQSVIYHQLSQLLSLTREESRALYIQAQKATEKSVSVYEFTHLVKELEYEKRYKMILALWQVAYADNNLDPHEEALIRKIADLVYLDHSDYIRAKLSAQPND